MLTEISTDHHAPFLAMIEDYCKKDPEALRAIFNPSISLKQNFKPSEILAEWTPSRFNKFIKESENEKQDWRPKAGKVSMTRYIWLSDSGVIQAYGLLRFPLDVKTENDGGNLEVSVPPSMRGKGFGSYCLALLLFEAVRAGLRRALVTCSANNQAARRIIEKNRGEFIDENQSISSNNAEKKMVSRYWISFST